MAIANVTAVDKNAIKKLVNHNAIPRFGRLLNLPKSAMGAMVVTKTVSSIANGTTISGALTCDYSNDFFNALNDFLLKPAAKCESVSAGFSELPMISRS